MNARSQALAELTWEEIASYLKSNSTLIIPVGSCEQHGKHLPLNTDILVTEAVAGIVAKKTGILIAPTVNYGVNLPCDSHYPGTCTLSGPTLHQITAEITEWWMRQGFYDFFLFTAHGDPFHLEALNFSADKNIHALDLYDIRIDDILQKQSCVQHACEAETSVMLYLFPDLVKTDKIEDFQTPPPSFLPYLHHLKSEPIPGSCGLQGFPSLADPQKGRLIFTRMTERALAFVRKAQAYPPQDF